MADAAFVNRTRELASLEERYASERAELYVLYGRRRVGKTELLRAFCEGKPHVFFVADLSTEANALAELTRQISQATLGDASALGAFPSWDAAFAFLARHADGKRLVVILDEFTYLIRANPALPSLLQRLWDTSLRHTRLMLVLCGSYVGLMEKHVLAYDAPLYGRRTAQWQLQPLGFGDARQLMREYSAVNQVRAFGLLGGVPLYLHQLDTRRPLLENVEQRMLRLGSFLYDEPRFLLLQELGEPHRYFSLLEAIAGGRTRQNEIAQAAGLTPSSASFYLDTLRALGLVEREVPVTETQPHKSRRGLYRLRDNFFRFWFRFVYPNHSQLERGETAPVRALVTKQLDEFIGAPFEEICREKMWRLHRAGAFGFEPRAIGRWWDEREEIDVVSVGEGVVVVGECKWSVRPVGVSVLDDLRRKTARLAERTGMRAVRYVLFARAGFTPALVNVARKEGIRLLGIDDIVEGE